jgi:hypothetical protein
MLFFILMFNFEIYDIQIYKDLKYLNFMSEFLYILQNLRIYIIISAEKDFPS